MKYTNNRNFMQAVVVALIAATTGLLVACGSDDDENQNTQTTSGYRVSIPATMESGTRALSSFGDGSISASFSTGEKVYVYNVTKSALNSSYLTSSSDGQTTTLVGTIDNTFAVGDQLKLLYHAGGTATSGSEGAFNYTGQNGTEPSAKTKDFAVATVTVGSIENNELKTTSTALFENVQSFMRLSFNFTDWDGTPLSTPSGINSLTISSANNSVATGYNAITNTYTKADNVISITNLSGVSYIAIPFDESVSNSDVLTFTATTSSTNPPALVYRCTKNAPTEGFKNGRYYSSSNPLSLKEMRIITVGIIDSWANKTSNYYVHYWGGSSGVGDILLTADNPQKTESSTIGVFYDSQTWHLLTAGVPKDITGWKIVHDSNNNGSIDGANDGDTWFGSDGTASNSIVYLFNWNYNDGNGNVNRIEYR